MLKPIIASLGLLLNFQAMSCDPEGKSGIVEENDLYIGVNDGVRSNLTEKDFNDVIDRVSRIYSPVIRSKGANLKVNRLWSDGTVNASAQQSGSEWIVNMYGGLARHPAITKDAFSLVMCHELGHHIGGAPKKKIFWIKMWASNEGQADYFGAMKCLRYFMEEDNNQEIIKNANVPAFVQQQCRTNFSDLEENAICQRTALAGLSLGNLFKDLKKLTTDLRFDTPDPSKVTQTDHNHPAPQCRLDTYFAGALCTAHKDEDVSDDDATVGVCSTENQDHHLTVRPGCWFANEGNEGGNSPFPWPPKSETVAVVH